MIEKKRRIIFLNSNYGFFVIMKGEKRVKEKRRWKNEWLKVFAQHRGLRENRKILVRERSMLKDGSYITRERRTGVVLKLYPYHFYCLMEDGSKESFRYNEFLGYESRLVRLKESAEGKMTDRQLNKIEKASDRTLFLLRGRWDLNPRTGRPAYQISSLDSSTT